MLWMLFTVEQFNIYEDNSTGHNCYDIAIACSGITIGHEYKINVYLSSVALLSSIKGSAIYDILHLKYLHWANGPIFI